MLDTAPLIRMLPSRIAEGFGMSMDDKRDAIYDTLKDALGITPETDWDDRPWLKDVFDDILAYEYDGATWIRTWSMDDAGVVTLGAEQKAQVTYEPVEPDASAAPVVVPVPAAPVATEGLRRLPEDELHARLTELVLGDHKLTAQLFEATRQNLGGTPILESSVKIREGMADDGTVDVKIIQPGWGSSGYYSGDLLESYGPDAWPAGTLMFWDHQSPEEAAARPEGSLEDLTGVLVTTPTFQEAGWDGPGLYAKSKIFPDRRETVKEMAPYIGVSVRGSGEGAIGEADGVQGFIFEQIYPSSGPWCSVDFVTAAGAGGKVREVLESAIGGRREEEAPVEITEAQHIEALAEKDREIEEAKTQGARDREALNEVLARDIVKAKIGEADLPEATKARLVESLSKGAPTGEDGRVDVEALQTKVDEAVAAEVAYLAEVTGSGSVVGNGSTAPAGDEAALTEVSEALSHNLERLGVPAEAAAKHSKF